ncbi:putative IQ motif and ankyrin repeat domain-containing protein [Pomacea canaliculata]|uniref:putative IQ motif and ankyrin repeat domain-containing protein n=1 Tax=Pomacea canaliculata TaxID=400727 RepID=UPI000D73261F|nr:putative IQ motif and ankyrin repeat domain-containing protein [Pomacea canaliculata]
MPPKAAAKPAPKGPVKPAAKPPAKVASGTKVGGAATTGGPKKTVAPEGKNKKDVSIEPPKERVWTAEDYAACKIQTKYRGYIAAKALKKKQQEKREYEELMDKLEKEAFLHLVRMEQEEAQRRQQKEDEERKQKAEERKRITRMLEAAFDGDVDGMKQILKEVVEVDNKNNIGNDVIGKALRTRHLMSIIECEDANGNTPLSEAATAGHVESIKFLLENGADPNTKGQFQRTPLYRAAFAGHMEAVECLLQNGADPRLFAADGQTPEHVASVEAIAQLLSEWNISQTEVLLRKLEQAKERRAEEEKKEQEAETLKLENQVEQAEKEFETAQKKLNKAYQELERRITEHDNAVASGFERTDITLQVIHDAEADLELTKIETEKLRDKLAQMRLRLRENQTGKETDLNDELPGIKVMVKELDDVLFRDIGNKIKDSGKWPLIIDTSGQATTFLRYRDTNYINTIRPTDMEEGRLRLAIVGALRFGKPLVLDMLEVNMFQTICDRFDQIMPGLMKSIMDRSILKNEKYMGLVKKEDGPEYERTKFNDLRLENFKLFIVSKNPFPPENLIESMYVIRVCLPG